MFAVTKKFNINNYEQIGQQNIKEMAIKQFLNSVNSFEQLFCRGVLVALKTTSNFVRVTILSSDFSLGDQSGCLGC